MTDFQFPLRWFYAASLAAVLLLLACDMRQHAPAVEEPTPARNDASQEVKPGSSSQLRKTDSAGDSKRDANSTAELEAVASAVALPEGTSLWAGWINAEGKPVEKESRASWFVYKRPGVEIEITPDGDKLRFITRSVDGALPQRILFGGASNQATMEVGP